MGSRIFIGGAGEEPPEPEHAAKTTVSPSAQTNGIACFIHSSYSAGLKKVLKTQLFTGK
jgi:hypothetical protein